MARKNEMGHLRRGIPNDGPFVYPCRDQSEWKQLRPGKCGHGCPMLLVTLDLDRAAACVQEGDRRTVCSSKMTTIRSPGKSTNPGFELNACVSGPISIPNQHTAVITTAGEQCSII